jgi:hypothetical protein
MTDQLITFETAELAYSKGFKWMTSDDKWYAITGELELSFQGYQENLNSYKLPVPTQSLLQRWLREVHEINIFIYCYGFGYYPIHENIPLPTGNVKYIDRRWNTQNKLNLGFKTYEEALEVGLIEALKLIK